MKGPDWNSTVVFITWHDFGGFYDHVPPPPLKDVTPQFENCGDESARIDESE